jgi:hypothetical protein
MQFEPVFIKIPRKPTTSGFSTIDISTFWAKAEEISEGISEAKGCYIFGLAPSGGAPKPWYVGKTTKSFKSEIFTDRNIRIYRECMDEVRKNGAPVIILLKAVTPKKGQNNKANISGLIEWVETFLISWALERNVKLKNSQKTRNWKEVIIPGLLNSPRGADKNAVALYSMFFGKGQKRKA